MIEQIDPFSLIFHFVATHSIQSFIQWQDLQELGTIELMVTEIYGRSSKNFILIVVDGLGPNDT
jgi:glycosylphosphatidylinositol transamidase (GPIT) subunit GPI8